MVVGMNKQVQTIASVSSCVSFRRERDVGAAIGRPFLHQRNQQASGGRAMRAPTTVLTTMTAIHRAPSQKFVYLLNLIVIIEIFQSDSQ